MNVLILLLLVVILSKSNSYSIDTKNSKADDSVLLQKFHHLQKRSEPEIIHIPTWSEILADVMVNRIKIFSFHKTNEQTAASTEYVGVAETQPGIFTRILSNVLDIFKTYVYDPWYRIYSNKNIEVENLQKADKAVDKPTEISDPNEDIEVIDIIPNEDVEIIEPKYHGKLSSNSTNPLEKCPDGLEMDEKGDCVDPKASKYIFNIPHQCPIGYRRDMFGICRIMI